MDQAAQAFDWQRMLFGNEEPWFLLEIVVRTLIVYGYGLLLLRWLGSRAIGQLSTVEFLLVIALGSAVGDSMFYPDVPLVHALLVVTVVVFANKGLDLLIARSRRAEKVLDGVPEQVIEDGVICADFIDSPSLGTSETFQKLRHFGIEHLGQVARAYVEADGTVTVFRSRTPGPGLPIAPPWEVEAPPIFEGGSVAEEAMLLACRRCGTLSNVTAGSAPGTCPHCSADHWTPARVSALYEAPSAD